MCEPLLGIVLLSLVVSGTLFGLVRPLPVVMVQPFGHKVVEVLPPQDHEVVQAFLLRCGMLMPFQ